MCGIIGYIAEKPYDAQAMMKSLEHRGPDDRGQVREHLRGQEAFLGHTRISIVDLSRAERQPMSTANDRVHLSFNGEIYNYEELKRDYLSGYTFHSSTDTEVLLYLYQELGIAFLDQLNGDFAIALLDLDREKLLLVRDRFGVKPLYYCSIGESLVFGSEMKTILASGAPLALSRSGLQKYLAFHYVPGNETLIEGVRRVPPAHYVEYDFRKRKTTTTRYWSLTKNADYARLSFADAQEAVYALLEDSVSKRLHSDVSVGVLISGGVDSSIISHFTRRDEKVRYYCGSTPRSLSEAEGWSSDAHFARLLADQWALPLEDISTATEHVNLESIRRVGFFSDDLVADAAQLSLDRVCATAAKTSRVLLSGAGADEIFYGYPSHQFSLYAEMLSRTGFDPSGRIGGLLQGGWDTPGPLRRVRRSLAKLLRHPASCRHRHGLFSVFSDFDTGLSLHDDAPEQVTSFIDDYFPTDRDTCESLEQFQFDSMLMKNNLYMDRMCMAHSIEARVPFLDHRIVELAHSLPRAYKLSRTGKTKRVLRAAFNQHLPQEILNRPKSGFALPVRTMLADRQWAELVDLECLSALDGLSAGAVREIRDEHLEGRRNHASTLFALISLQEWLALYGQQLSLGQAF